MSTAILEAHGLTKAYSGVMALSDVSIRIDEASIHALLGENGAGKSTLIKLVTGLVKPDAGVIRFSGHELTLGSAAEARAAGIGVVHQERELFRHFTVGENILIEKLAQHPLRPIDYPALHREAGAVLDQLGIAIDTRRPVSDLSVAEMQLVEIAKALALAPRLLLLDEPTASLSPGEAQHLFDLLRRLRQKGVSTLFISHKLNEVEAICDSVTVLRDGRNACESRSLADLDRAALIRLMIGRDHTTKRPAAGQTTPGATALELKGVATSAGHRDINLTVCKGEVVGIYGLVGAGRTELAQAIFGQQTITAGELFVNGARVIAPTAFAAVHRHRIGYVSEDRKGIGLIIDHSVLQNVGITSWLKLARGGWLTDGTIWARCREVVAAVEVKYASRFQKVKTLSGGNQQKISVGKWLASGAEILIVDEPSVGIDIRARAYMHELLRDLARKGAAVLVISSDLTEIVDLVDRVLVMKEFRLVAERPNSFDYDDVSLWTMEAMSGGGPAP